MSGAATPVGNVTWEGDLTPESIIKFADGKTIPIQRWIAMTNGACLEWLDGHL